MLTRIINFLVGKNKVADISPVRTDKNELNCCKEPKLSTLEDFGHARSFDFMHATCKKCRAHWMNVFCTANGISGYERISKEDARRLLRSNPGPERKAILTNWADENL